MGGRLGSCREKAGPARIVERRDAKKNLLRWAGVLLAIAAVVRAEEPAPPTPPVVKPKLLLDNPDEPPKPATPPSTVPLPGRPANSDQPAPLVTPPPGTDNKPAEVPPAAVPTGPRIAKFADYVIGAPIDNTPINRSNPVTANYASPVANELARNTSNEALFLPGAGPIATPLYSGQPVSEAPLITSGALTVRPSVAIDNFLNDNFFGTIHVKRGSWLRNEAAGLALTYAPSKDVTAGAFYNFVIHDYSSSVVRDYYDETAGFNLRVQHFGVEGLSFNLSELYTQVGNTIISPLADTIDVSNLEFRTGSRYATNALPVSLQYESGPWAIQAGYEYDVMDYFARVNQDQDAQQNIFRLRAANAVLGDHMSVFAEYSFDHTRYPSSFDRDYVFEKAAAGIAGSFQRLTYRARAGCHIDHELGLNRVTAEPALSMDVNYNASRYLNFSAFANHELDVGVLTGKRLTDSFGGVIDIHPMRRGTLTLTDIYQNVERDRGHERVKTTTLTYRHLILNRLEPRLGMKYTEENRTGAPLERGWTGFAGIKIKTGARSSVTQEFYHEDIARSDGTKRATDRFSTGFDYRINFFSKVNFNYDHVERRDSQFGGSVQINELRLGVNLTW